MGTLLLSGVGGSSNWLPLVFPLAAVVAVIYFIDFIIKFVKKRKQEHLNRLIQENTSSYADQEITDNQS